MPWNLLKCKTVRRAERDRNLKVYVWGEGGCEDVAYYLRGVRGRWD